MILIAFYHLITVGYKHFQDYLKGMNMSDKERRKEIRHLAAVGSTIQAIETIDLAGIFYMTSSEVFKAIFEQIFKYIMLPTAAISNLMIAALAWRQSSLSKYEGHSVARAVVETLAALAISAAVIGALFFTATFTLIAPIVFGAAVGTKALFNAGSAIYFGVKSARADNESEKFSFRKKALESGVAAIVGTLATIAVVAVMIFAKPALAILGIVGGVFGAGAAVMKGIELANPEIKKEKSRDIWDFSNDSEEKPLTRNARTAKVLSITRRPPPPTQKPVAPAALAQADVQPTASPDTSKQPKSATASPAYRK